MTLAADPSRGAVLPVLVPVVSLAATAGMATSAVALLPAVAVAGGLVVLAAATAVSGRGRGLAHLAAEPLGMAFMLVLAGVHGHAAPSPAPSHAHGAGWVLPALAVAVAVVSAGCLVSALRTLHRVAPSTVARPSRTARSSPPRPLLAAALASLSAMGMCAMAAHMLLA